MAAPQGALVAWRAVFAALGVLMVATLVYTCATDGSPFRPELLTPWMMATLVDFYVNVIAISVWVVYKESNWISSAVWVVLLVCFGSAATCAYIVKKLFEVTPTGPSEDPLDLLLLIASRILNDIRKLQPCCPPYLGAKLVDHLRCQSNISQKRCSCVIIGRIFFSSLGIFMAAVVTYTIITDGLPFRKDLLTLWMAATLIDFYINVFAISVWVAHKESTWVTTVIWICLLICFGRHFNMWLYCHSTSPSIISRPNLPCAIEFSQQVWNCDVPIIVHLV
ncbi:hypothetical protein ACP4OV_030668 [Aristida adscensionis]